MYYSNRINLAQALADLAFVRDMGHEDARILHIGVYHPVWIPQPTNPNHLRIDQEHIDTLREHQTRMAA